MSDAPDFIPDSSSNSPDFIPDNQMNNAEPQSSAVPVPASQSAPDFISDADTPQKDHSGILDTLLAGERGLERGMSLGFSDVLAKKYRNQAEGLSDEDIKESDEAHPIASSIGEIGGGAALLAATQGLGIEALLGKGLVSTLAQGAAVGGISAVNNDIAFGDPNLNASKIASDGLTSALWGAGSAGVLHGIGTLASKSFKNLAGLAEKLGISELPPETLNNIRDSEMNVSPLMESAVSQNPELQHMFQTLQESTSSKSGFEAQGALKDFKNQAQEALVSSLGKTPEDVTSLGDISNYDVGKDAQTALASQLKQEYEPISDLFNKVQSKFKNVPFTAEDGDAVQEQIGKLIQDKGYYLSEDLPASKVLQSTLKDLGNVQTLDDLRKFTSLVGDKTQNPELWGVGKDLRTILRNSESNVLSRSIEEGAPELYDQHALARSSYGELMNTMDSLNDRLHVGKYYGPDTFIKSLKEMAPEDVLRRLSGKNDANLLDLVSQRFPDTANVLKDYQVNSALSAASKKAAPNELINPNVLFNTLDKMSPELKQFAFPEATEGALTNKFQAVRGLLENIPGKMNPSGTAKTLQSFWKHVPGTAIALLSTVFGHGLAGVAAGAAADSLTNKIPDALRLKILKQGLPLDGIAGLLNKADETIGNKARLIFTGASSQARKIDHSNE